MDQDLRSLLVAAAVRSGSIKEPALQAMLSKAGLSPESVSNLDPQDMIARLSERDPLLAFLVQRLVHTEETTDDENSGSAEQEIDSVNQERQREIAVGKLRRHVESMYAELEQLREKNDRMAAALGACYLCWGEDLQCEICGGSGSSGAFEPDIEEFAELVAPALRRIRNRSHLSKKGEKTKQGTPSS